MTRRRHMFVLRHTVQNQCVITPNTMIFKKREPQHRDLSPRLKKTRSGKISGVLRMDLHFTLRIAE
jgi:hypothetical protein